MSQNITNALNIVAEYVTAFHTETDSFDVRDSNYLHLLESLREFTNVVHNEYADYLQSESEEWFPTRTPTRRRRRARTSKAISQRDMNIVLPDPCSICYEDYTKGNSISTSCGHTFCKTCYEGHENSVDRRKKVCCPLCRQETPLITEYRARKPRRPRNTAFQNETATQVGIDIIDLTV